MAGEKLILSFNFLERNCPFGRRNQVSEELILSIQAKLSELLTEGNAGDAEP